MRFAMTSNMNSPFASLGPVEEPLEGPEMNLAANDGHVDGEPVKQLEVDVPAWEDLGVF